ncbi:MAG: hypothetical protein ABFD50_08825, partial [Smithella sp.]
MIDRAVLKKELTRIAVGIVFLCTYFFMLSEISTLANQVVVWVTGIVFVLYGLTQYRDLQVARAGAPDQSGPQKLKQ